jgi:hypothetical protein
MASNELMQDAPLAPQQAMDPHEVIIEMQQLMQARQQLAEDDPRQNMITLRLRQLEEMMNQGGGGAPGPGTMMPKGVSQFPGPGPGPQAMPRGPGQFPGPGPGPQAMPRGPGWDDLFGGRR